jgi:prophage regulatory protein
MSATTIIYRLPAARAAAGVGRTKFLGDVQAGLMVPSIKLGPRACGFPASEVEAVIKARIAGATDEQLRRLVARLVAERTKLLAEVLT